MFNSNLIRNILVLVCGVFLAIWMGMSIVTEQTATLIKIAAVSLFLICLFLGQKVWLLMIFFSSMNLLLIRGFGTTEIGQMLFILFTLAIFMMRRLKLNATLGELEFWALLIFGCVLQTYLRNPVGLNILGDSSIGAKPYIIMALSMTSGLVLSLLKVDPKHLKLAMWLSFLGSIVSIPLIILRGGQSSMTGEGGSTTEGANRIGLLNILGTTLAKWLVIFTSPLRACLNPFWGVILLLSLAAAAGSGYRNAIASVLLIYIVAQFYRGGVMSVFVSMISAALVLTVVALINLNFPLPANIQRAMSPFPGTWEKHIVDNANLSSEWRIEMWMEALKSERWINNKVLGDGLGFSRQDLEANERLKDSKVGNLASGLLAQQESMLINGSYHSGPVHTIRSVGYVGLAILLLAMIHLAARAHRQIVRCKGTEWYPLALFFCIPIITHPIFFVFIFGEYPTGVTSWFSGMAILRLMEKNLPTSPHYKQAAG
jgi:hypothetical protein